MTLPLASLQFAITPPAGLPGLPLTCDPNTGIVTNTGPVTQGPYSIVVSATNKLHNTISTCTFNNTVGTGTATVTFAISPAKNVPAITSALQAFGTETVPFVYGTTASNSPTAFSDGGALAPLGLTIDPKFGIITGVPTKLALPYIAFSGDTNGSTTISNVTNIALLAALPANTQIFGPNIPVGTTIFAVNVGADTITISGTGATAQGTAPAAIPGEAFLAGNAVGSLPSAGGAPVFTGTIAAGSPIISGLPSTANLFPGNPVFGPGIPATTTIVAVPPTTAAGTIMLSQNATQTLQTFPQAFMTAMTTSVSITATNAAGSSVTPIKISIAPAIPQIVIPNSSLVQTTITGNLYQFQANATSFTDPTVSATQFFASFIPAPQNPVVMYSTNISMSRQSGLLSGTPLDADADNYTVTLTALNNRGYSNSAFSQFTIAIQAPPGATPPPIIQPPLTAVAIVGCTFTYQIQTVPSASGFGSLTLPQNHLFFDSATGLISGTPQPADALPPQPKNVNLQAFGTLANGTLYLSSQANLKLTILASPLTPPTPSLLPPFSVGAVVGTPLDYPVVTTPDVNDFTQNQLPIFMSAPGLPTGLSLNPSSVQAQGQPLADINGFTTNTASPTPVNITVINATGSDTKAVVFTVAPITIFNPNDSPATTLAVTGTVGQPFPSPPFTGTPGAGYQIFATGNSNAFTIDPNSADAPVPAGLTLANFSPTLPAGLTLNSNTGVISGIPNSPPNPGGAASVTYVIVTASNGTFTPAKAALQITISANPAGAPSINNTNVNHANSPQKPAAPPLIMNVYDGVSCAPLAPATSGNAGGQFDSTMTFQSDSFQITALNMPPVPVALPNKFGAVGLPNGMSVDATTGQFSGSTHSLGTYTVTITATNINGTDAQTLTLNVLAIPPVIGPLGTISVAAGTPSLTVPIAPNPNPGSQPIFFTFVNPASVPPWLTINGANFVFTNPNPPGIYPANGQLPIVVQAQNAAPGSVQANLTIQVTTPPVFTVANPNIIGTIGDPIISLPITATGVPPPTIMVDPSTPLLANMAFPLPPPPVLSGSLFMVNPTAFQSTSIIFDATSPGLPPAKLTVNVSINHMILTSPLLVTGVEQVPVSPPYTITATGSPTSFNAIIPPAAQSFITFSGKTLNINPPAGSAGSYTVFVSASNALDTTGLQPVLIAISNKAGTPVITTNPLLVVGVVGQSVPFPGGSGSQVVSTDPNATFAFTGSALRSDGTSIPAAGGVDNVTISSAGLITGIPNAAFTFNIPVVASNAIGPGPTANLTLAISPDAGTPAIISPLTAQGLQNSPFTYTIMAETPNDGSDFYKFTTVGFAALGIPDLNNSLSGLISGTPTVGGNNLPVTIIAASQKHPGKQATATLLLTLTKQSPAITSLLTANGTVGVPFPLYTITATGVPPITFTVDPTQLPPGLMFNSPSISGIPTLDGTFMVTLNASNAFPPPDKQILKIVIAPAPVSLAASDLATGIQAEPFSFQIKASGTLPITFSVDVLPPGLMLNSSTGIISGTPTQQGTFTVNVTAQNTVGGVVFTATQVLTIVIVQRPDDSDGDGFPDDVEIALGTNPFDATSTPFGNGRPANVAHPVQVVNITAMQIKLNFAGGSKDTITASGTISVEKSFTKSSHQLTLVIPALAGFASTPPGIVRIFLLGGKGTASSATLADGKTSASGSSSFKLSVSRKTDTFLGLVAKFQFKLASGTDFAPVLATRGLTNNQTFKNTADVVRVSFLLDPTSPTDPIFYDAQKVMIWNVKKGKVGTARPGKGNQNLNPNP